MSKIIESLKRLNVETENDARAYEQDNERVDKKIELILSLEERVSLDQNYILSVCGTQRQILYFFIEHFVANLRKRMIHVLQICFYFVLENSAILYEPFS